MKSLPTLTICAAAAVLAVWMTGPGGLERLRLQADEGAQAESPAADTSKADEDDASEDAIAQARAEEAEGALKVLQDARYRLVYERRSVQAMLRETVSMGARRFRGEGTYIAGPYP